jgi:hypothetical protein
MQLSRMRTTGRVLAWAAKDALILGLGGAILGGLFCTVFGLLDLMVHPNVNRVASFALGGGLAGALALGVVGFWGRLVIGDTREMLEGITQPKSTAPVKSPERQPQPPHLAGCTPDVATCNGQREGEQWRFNSE